MHQTQQMLSPRQAMFHQHEQTLIMHCYFEAKVPKPLILQVSQLFLIKNQRNRFVLHTFPAFLIKNQRKNCVLPALPTFLIKN